MGQSTHRDPFYPGLCPRPERLQRHAAARLELGATGHLGDRGTQLRVVHVVQQQPRRSGGERLLDLSRVAHLDLERIRQLRRRRAHAFDRLRDPAGSGDVVLLDQDRVVQAGAVVARPPGRHRRLLQRPHPRGRLARVEHPRPGPLHRARGARRHRGNPRQMRQEVQRRALSRQQRTRAPLDHHHRAAVLAPYALLRPTARSSRRGRAARRPLRSTSNP